MPGRIDEAIMDIADSADVSENKAIVALLELGLTFYRTLPASMRGRLWQRDETFAQQQSFRLEAERGAEKLIEHSKLDSFVIFRASAEKKRLLRSRAQDAKLDVSKFIRSRVLGEKRE